MPRKRKQRAYLRKELNSYWLLPMNDKITCIEWVARDEYVRMNGLGVVVARAKTRKECEGKCRKLGYVPERR